MKPAERLDEAAARELHPPAGDPLPHDPRDDQDAHAHGLDALELARIGFVAVVVVVTWLHPWRPLPSFDAVAWGAAIIGAYPIFKEAPSALFAGRMTMELSMTIALVAALAIGEAFTALVIVLFVLVAEVLEHLTVGERPQGDTRPHGFPAPQRLGAPATTEPRSWPSGRYGRATSTRAAS